MKITTVLPQELRKEFDREKKFFPDVKKKGNFNLLDNIDKDDFRNAKEKIKQLKSEGYKNLIIVGNGGSITTTMAFMGLPKFKKKNSYVLNSTEPTLVKEVKERFPVRNTVVMFISKSGKTTTVLQNYHAFSEYRKVLITQEGTPLHNIGKKEGDMIHTHPDVGGRFTGPTVVTLMPLLFLSYNMSSIMRGFKFSYSYNRPSKKYSEAKRLAEILYFLEKKGYKELYMPMYSSYFEKIEELITQLFHETVCKGGKGQSVLCVQAPESQHHTTQRFMGGRRNMAGIFFTVQSTQDYFIYSEHQKELNGLNLKDSFYYEFEGSFESAKKEGIPVVNIELESLEEEELAYLIGFLHHVVIYGAILRDENPFGQPAVEDSKRITWELISGKKSNLGK